MLSDSEAPLLFLCLEIHSSTFLIKLNLPTKPHEEPLSHPELCSITKHKSNKTTLKERTLYRSNSFLLTRTFRCGQVPSPQRPGTIAGNSQQELWVRGEGHLCDSEGVAHQSLQLTPCRCTPQEDRCVLNFRCLKIQNRSVHLLRKMHLFSSDVCDYGCSNFCFVNNVEFVHHRPILCF